MSADSIWQIDKIVIVSKSEFQVRGWATDLVEPTRRSHRYGGQEQLITLQ